MPRSLSAIRDLLQRGEAGGLTASRCVSRPRPLNFCVWILHAHNKGIECIFPTRCSDGERFFMMNLSELSTIRVDSSIVWGRLVRR